MNWMRLKSTTTQFPAKFGEITLIHIPSAVETWFCEYSDKFEKYLCVKKTITASFKFEYLSFDEIKREIRFYHVYYCIIPSVPSAVNFKNKEALDHSDDCNQECDCKDNAKFIVDEK